MLRSSVRIMDEISSGTTVDQLGEQIVSLAGRIAAATCRWLLLVAEFDRRRGHAPAGLASAAAWLSYSCSLSRRTALEHVRVARALAAYPRLAEEMTAGRLSYSHIRAISRVTAEGEPRLVEDLIEVALHGTVAHLEVVVRGLRIAADDPIQRPDYLRSGWDEENRWRLSTRLDAESGALIDAALTRIERVEGTTRERALARMAEIALAALADSDRPMRPLRGEERAAIVVHLEAPRSAERAAAHIQGGAGLEDRVVEWLACSGRVRTVIERRDRKGRRQVLDVGRSQRLATRRQYRALIMRDGTCCAYPGCANTRWLDAHHIVHWLHGGRTDLANLMLLCTRHHRSHHDGAFTIARCAGGGFRFTRADGITPPAPRLRAQRAEPIENEHEAVAAVAITTRWSGQRLDHSYAVGCLATRRLTARRGIS